MCSQVARCDELRYTHNRMKARDIIYLGIDLAPGRRPFAFAALDADLRVLALGQGGLEDVLAYATGLAESVAGLGAPTRPNNGLMGQAEFRAACSPPPAEGHFCDLRAAEYDLIQRGVSLARTPAHAESAPTWIKRGFGLRQRLEELDYRPYPTDDAPRQWLEAQAEAGYWALLGQEPFAYGTLEGRLQRQLALHENGLPVSDPMNFFEEITRHRLLKGILPTRNIYSAAELGALMVAYITWLAVNTPGRVLAAGDPQEGQIYLPTPEAAPPHAESHSRLQSHLLPLNFDR